MEKRYVYEVYGDEVPDVKVWELLRGGEIRALKTLFLRHHKPLFCYAVKLSGDRFLAEDSVQDLFFRIWERRKHLGKVRSIKSYLWVSLRRDMMKTMNSNKKQVLTEDIVTYFSPEREGTPDEPVIHFQQDEFILHEERKSEYKVALTRALNQLPSRQREAILLKFFHGMGYDEIEQIMSINYQTARNYVYDGIQAMKTYFDEDPDKPVPFIFSLFLLSLLG